MFSELLPEILRKEEMSMKKNTGTLYDAVTNERILSATIEDFLIKEAEGGATVTISMVIELLKIIKSRLNMGQEIIMERTGTILTRETFNAYLIKHFSGYICGEVLD